jgi:hypothetical protein
MKLKISKITENRETYKPSIEDIVFNLYESRDNFKSYEFEDSKRSDRKLVFKNINHKNELHKHLMFEHFYIVLLVLLIVLIYSLFNENYLMILASLIGILYIPYKLISSSEVSYKLIFEGIYVYETNHIGKRINEFNPFTIESSDSEKYENDFIFLCGKKRGKKENFLGVNDEYLNSLMIMEGTNFEIRDLIRKYFNDFSFKNTIRMRGQ